MRVASRGLVLEILRVLLSIWPGNAVRVNLIMADWMPGRVVSGRGCSRVREQALCYFRHVCFDLLLCVSLTLTLTLTLTLVVGLNP